MEQIPQSIINSILGGALAALGWFARQIWDAIKELRSDLARLREELPSRYVPKDEFHQFSSALFTRMLLAAAPAPVAPMSTPKPDAIRSATASASRHFMVVYYCSDYER